MRALRAHRSTFPGRAEREPGIQTFRTRDFWGPDHRSCAARPGMWPVATVPVSPHPAGAASHLLPPCGRRTCAAPLRDSLSRLRERVHRTRECASALFKNASHWREAMRMPAGRGLPRYKLLTQTYHEHPVVLPQVSHFKHVPFLTSVKFWHSGQASPT